MTLYIANTAFEWELWQELPPTLSEVLARDALSLQLQYLPMLYAGNRDKIYVTQAPLATPFWQKFRKDRSPEWVTKEDVETLSKHEVSSWGGAPSVVKWAKNCGMDVDFPSIAVQRRVNSKAFSFEISPLPGGALLHSLDDVKRWVKGLRGKGVLKSCFGRSGGGHCFCTGGEELGARQMQFALRECCLAGCLIAEPWVERRLDFSTQWVLNKSGQACYLGATVMRNTQKGSYNESICGLDRVLFGPYLAELKEQIEYIQTHLVYRLHKEGYFGHFGVDAMIYEDRILQPVVEINARQTMGWALLSFYHNNLSKDATVHLSRIQPKGLSWELLPSFTKGAQLYLSF